MSIPPGRDDPPRARTRTGATSARTRAVLTREAIVDAAVDLVDAAGPDALTMRAVAQRLGSGVMSLYRHIPDRDTLLDLVLQAMTDEIPQTPLTGDWRTDATTLARDVRAALTRRPQLTVLLTSRADRGIGGLAALDRSLAIFRSAGLSPRDAVEANHALGNLVAGAALWDAIGMGGATGHDRHTRTQAAAAAIKELPVDAYPNVHWAGDTLYSGTPDHRFEAGLAMLLDGIQQHVTSTTAAEAPRRTRTPRPKPTRRKPAQPG